jgi:hypothetical protein
MKLKIILKKMPLTKQKVRLMLEALYYDAGFNAAFDQRRPAAYAGLPFLWDPTHESHLSLTGYNGIFRENIKNELFDEEN